MDKSGCADERDVARLESETAALKAAFEAALYRLDGDIQALDRLTDAKFVTQKTMLDAQAAQVKIALDSAEKAILKSETAIDKRFDGVNEFRSSLADLSTNMATRRELEASVRELKESLKQHSEQLTELRSRLDIGPAGLAGLQQQQALAQGARQGVVSAREWFLAGSAVLGVAVAVVLAFN